MRRRSLDPKVIVGIVLMVTATAIGALTMQQASRRIALWQLDHGLSAGTRLTQADVHAVEVALGRGVNVYATVSTPVVGRVLARDVSGQELLPLSVLQGASRAPDRVTVPLEAMHLPPNLRRGERVDVWLTPALANGSSGKSQRVLAAARVDAVATTDVSGRPSVVLAVRRSDVAMVIAALRLGAIDLVGVGTTS
jgi:hypothetical protein